MMTHVWKLHVEQRLVSLSVRHGEVERAFAVDRDEDEPPRIGFTAHERNVVHVARRVHLHFKKCIPGVFLDPAIHVGEPSELRCHDATAEALRGKVRGRINELYGLVKVGLLWYGPGVAVIV